MTLEKAIANLAKLDDLLDEDVQHWIGQRRKSDTQFTRRALLQSVFMMMEALTNGLKQVCLAGPSEPLSPADKAILREETYELDDHGRARIRSPFIRLKDNVRFSFASISRCYNPKFEAQLEGDGWEAFQAVLLVRSRFVHPKEPTEIDISQDDIHTLLAAYKWFRVNFLLAFEVAKAGLSESTSVNERQQEAQLIQKLIKRSE